MSRLEWHTTTRRRPWLAAFTGLIAIFAVAGAVGLMTGTLGLEEEVVARFPFGSAVFGGLALVLVVGVPMGLVCYFGSRPDRRTSGAAIVAGCLLIAWVAVEIGFVQTYSWLQVVFAFAGVLVAHAGLRDVRSR
ncbi:hypothetical protein [Amycolatopsis pithecellobii]|uniref:Uncharacterized protein n=1 Tax=Amycolatopsis pithecellobii TaxID=664692 RepID=A0A6N7Z2X7_9PSEU|nr:hypothetical protein [Amycolatopsis pithecellobii]MTD53146.1 hypothetical protein [Amycolatopsis pithecellobii]